MSPFVANALWLGSSLPAWSRLRSAIHNPGETQHRILRRYLTRHAESLYGRRFRFSDIRSYREFAAQVPLTHYTELTPWIDQIKRGEQNVLSSDPVTHLVPTSGSTEARKLIPFTNGLQREFGEAVGAWISDLYLREPPLMCGPAYWSITPAFQENVEASAVPIGFASDSSYLGGRKKRLVDCVLAVPPALSTIQDLDVFRFLTLLRLLRQRELRLISVWHPSFLLLLLDALPQLWPELLSALKSGKSFFLEHVSPEVRRAVNLTSSPRRADELSSAHSALPESIWPKLRLVSCWGEAHAFLSMGSLQARLPHVTIQPKGLLATEGVVTIPFQGANVLAVCSHFFEFLDDRGVPHLVDDMKTGGIYEVVLTTGGGLWRYRLGDRVEVQRFVGKTSALQFIGRTGRVSDQCGEKLSEALASRAIVETIQACGGTVSFAMLAPETSDAGTAYVLYVEGEVASETAVTLDQRLRENPHYGLCRDLGQLGPIKLHRIAQGGYQTYAARETAAGKRLGDIKPCALSERDDWARHFVVSLC